MRSGREPSLKSAFLYLHRNEKLQLSRSESASGQPRRVNNHAKEEVAPNRTRDQAMGMNALMLVCLSNKEP